MTAHYLVTSVFPVSRGTTCSCTPRPAAWACCSPSSRRARGARVIATVGSADKERLAREAGAADVIRYRELDDLTRDLPAEVRALTDGAGVHAVFDSVGKDTFDASLASLRRRGTLVLFGASSGPVPPVDPQRLNAAGSVFLTRPTLDDYIGDARRAGLARARAVRRGPRRRARRADRRHLPPGRRGRGPPRARVALHDRKGPSPPVTITTLNPVRTLNVEVWSDIACPWCYIGKRRFETALADFPHRDHVEVTWRSYELSPTTPVGPGRPEIDALAEHKGIPSPPGQAHVRAGHRRGRRRGSRVRLRPDPRRQHLRRAPPGPPARPTGGAAADRVLEALFSAHFEHGADLGDDETLVRIVSDAGLDADAVAGRRWTAARTPTPCAPTRTRRARSA